MKWEGYSKDQCTWEPLSNLRNVKGMIKEYEDLIAAGIAPKAIESVEEPIQMKDITNLGQDKSKQSHETNCSSIEASKIDNDRSICSNEAVFQSELLHTENAISAVPSATKSDASVSKKPVIVTKSIRKLNNRRTFVCPFKKTENKSARNSPIKAIQSPKSVPKEIVPQASEQKLVDADEEMKCNEQMPEQSTMPMMSLPPRCTSMKLGFLDNHEESQENIEPEN